MFLSLLLYSIAVLCVGVAADCNPLTTNGCSAIPGLAASSYSIDFTQAKSLPKDWIIADASNITFGSNGVEFNFNKRKEAPYIWTNFYVAYGRIDVNMKVARGTGVVTSAVMFSDDADEIDWEFSGSNFGAGQNTGKIQTNIFAKGITGNWDRGTIQDVSPPPQNEFHTYTLNWTPDQIDWILNGKTIYTHKNTGQKTGNYQFPQTPSRLHVGMWDAGDPDTAWATRNWAGGYTNYSEAPYTAYLKWVKISTPYPCKAWKYPNDFSGSWSDVKCTNETIPVSTSASQTSTAILPKNTEAEYTVVSGDNGYDIATKIGSSFEQLNATNPGIDWDKLNIGQKLKNPNANTSAPASSLLSSLLSSAIKASPTQASTIARPDPTSSATQSYTMSSNNNSSITASAVTMNSTMTCQTDDCLGYLLSNKYAASASIYCSSVLANSTARLRRPIGIPGCDLNTTRIRSACSCLQSKAIVHTRSFIPLRVSASTTSSSLDMSATWSSSIIPTATGITSKNIASRSIQDNVRRGYDWLTGWMKDPKKDKIVHDSDDEGDENPEETPEDENLEEENPVHDPKDGEGQNHPTSGLGYGEVYIEVEDR